VQRAVAVQRGRKAQQVVHWRSYKALAACSRPTYTRSKYSEHYGVQSVQCGLSDGMIVSDASSHALARS